VPNESRSAPRFLADVMLERLARWLRVLGVDVESADATSADRDIARRAVAEGRVLLTRDRRLPVEHEAGEHLVVRSGVPLEQLAEVVARYAIALPPELFTRCLLCNVPLEPGPDADTPAGARRCPRCCRDYWEGSHTRRMRAALARAFPALRGGVGG
jgi:uncharacterized protein with PIN domain